MMPLPDTRYSLIARLAGSADGAKNTITVDINGEGEKTFAVGKDAYIRMDGKPVKLSDLPNEAPVVLTLRADQKTVASIEAKSP